MTFVDRYRAVGLDRNPFSTQALAETAVFVDRGLRVPPPGSCTMVQIIGDRGYGKSTHLRHWQSSQPGPYHYIPLAPYRQRWAAPPSAAGAGITVYGDEIDRMPSPLRRSWFRRLAAVNATLVVGTHVDLATTGRRAGFDVITHNLAPLTRIEVHKLVDQRLSAGSITGAKTIGLSGAELDDLFAASGGIPREVEERCHRMLADRLR